MGTTEIILLIIGGLIFILSFLIPAGRKKGSTDETQISEEKIREMIDKEVQEAKIQISDIVDETITYSMEKTERAMERISNEKIMAVNEYSDTVLDQIDKNHKEVVFLYDMLNDKHENLKTTVSEAVKTATEVRQTVRDAEITAKEAEQKAIGAEEKAKDAEEKVREAQENVMVAVAQVQAATENQMVVQEEKTQEEYEPSENLKLDDDFVPIQPERVMLIPDYVAEYEAAEEIQQITENSMPESLQKAAMLNENELAELLGATVTAVMEEAAMSAETFQADVLQTEIQQAEKLDVENEMEADMHETDISEADIPETDALEADEVIETVDKVGNVDLSLSSSANKGNRNNNERILELHKAGKSNMAIAKDLGLGIGEVKLVIDLFEGI